MTPASVAKVPFTSATDNIREYFPPAGTKPRRPEEGKFDALAKTAGWAPHNANLDGSQRAVYDPVAHKTTLYTFNGCLLYTSPSPRDKRQSRMPSSA